MSDCASHLPDQRPTGLRLTAVHHSWFRLDTKPPRKWSWTAYPTPRHRFDSASATFRIRFAGDAQRVMMRERFDASDRIVSVPELDLHLVELVGTIRVLELRQEKNLDALGLDDQISTSRAPDVWSASHTLADRIAAWYGGRCHGIVYRSRTTPQRSANLASFRHAPLTARNLGRLSDQYGLLAACVHSDGFTIEGW